MLLGWEDVYSCVNNTYQCASFPLTSEIVQKRCSHYLAVSCLLVYQRGGHISPPFIKIIFQQLKSQNENKKKTWSEQFKKGYSLNISQRCCRSITNNLKRKPLHTAPDHSLKLIVNLAKLQDTKLLSANMQSTPTRSPLTILFPQHLALTAGAVK